MGDARIQRGVQQVNNQIDHNEGRGRDRNNGQYHWNVLAQHGFLSQTADSGAGEDGFHQHGPGNGVAHLQTDQRQQRQRGVLERMAGLNLRAAQAFGVGGDDVGFFPYALKATLQDLRIHRSAGDRQRDGGQDQAGEALIAGRREPAKAEREQLDEQQTHPEHRHREAQRRQA